MLLLLIASLQAAAGQELPDSSQVLRLLKGLHSEVRDISFVYEGNIQLVGPETITGKPEIPMGAQYQGGFSYREEDGATLIDMYRIREAPNAPVARIKFSLLKGSMQELALLPDEGMRNPSPTTSAGFPGSLDQPDSPYRFFFHWSFQGLTEASAAKFKVRAWEVIDGHRCLVVDEGIRSRYWIDMERGGNVLQYENYAGAKMEHLRYRTRDIKLKKFKAGTKEVWLPVGGTTDTFLWGSGYHTVPIFRETYAVVNGSVILDAGLGDGHFSVTSKVTAPGELDKLGLSGRYRDAMAKPPPEPMRTDATGVRAQIDTQLAEADRQEKMLAASAPSRAWWSWVGASQFLLAFAAFAAIATAVVMRRRAG